MQLIDDNAVSRGLIRVEPGEDFVESLQILADAAGWSDAFVTGAGTLELVELAEGGDGSVATLENAQVLSLSGRITRRDGRPMAELCASLLSGGRVRTGRIVAAMTGGLLLVVDAVSTGHAVASTTVAVAPSPRAPTEDRWTEDAAAGESRSATKPLSQSFSTKPVLQRLPASLEDAPNPEVEAGDFLDHPQLGLCEVVGDDGSGGTRIRMSSGRVRVLRLDLLRVLAGNDQSDGRHVFKVVGPRQQRR